MAKALSVVQAFGPHARGDVVKDEALIAEILAGENSHNVVQVNLPAETQE